MTCGTGSRTKLEHINAMRGLVARGYGAQEDPRPADVPRRCRVLGQAQGLFGALISLLNAKAETVDVPFVEAGR